MSGFEEAIRRVQSYVRIPGREDGGAIEAILMDGCVEQGDVDVCVMNAGSAFGDQWEHQDVEIARMFASLDRVIRVELVKAFHARR